VPFTTIEEQNYDHLYKMMCGALGLNVDGSPAVDDWEPDLYIESMRTWLRRLRETCLHPQVGSQNRRALGRGQGPLRTVNEVLETMIEQNQSDLRTQERAMILAQVLRGQIVNNDKSNPSRSEDALKLYQDAVATAEEIVKECRDECAAEDLRMKEARAAEKRVATEQPEFEDSDSDSDDGSRGQGKKKRFGALKKQLRSALEALHVCVFYVATSYYQMKENEKTLRETEDTDALRQLEAREVENYDLAKAIRKELLQPAYKQAIDSINKIVDLQRPGYGMVPKIPILDNSGGIENRKVLDKFDTISDVMDAQANLINEWRGKVIKILTGPLVDAEDDQEITGEEYEDSTKLQDELFVYVSGLRAVISDRQQCISGVANFLMEVELKEAIKAAKDGKGHAPELLLKVVEQRKKLRIKPEDGSLQAILSEGRSLASNLRMSSASSRAAVEASIIEGQVDEIRKITFAQRETVKALEKEQSRFHSCMNERVEYYRQLQELSDTVAPWKDELDEKLDTAALDAQIASEETHNARLATLKTKRRFLLHLRAESSQQSEARICVICTDSFENGVLTICGHQYCKDCITAWWRSHRTCPECRRVLTRNDVHDITYRPQQLKAKEEQNDSSSSVGSSPSRETSSAAERSSASSIYSSLSAATMNEIKSIELEGSFGTKIDTICRHLIWLRENDPGAKSIIFSQYNDFLEVLSSALKHFKISGVSIREPKGIEKFRRDPSKECFLLDAKSDSSGLNLVNATHVFLCEPLVNAAIELQAVARVHRIGQMRDTNVYMYLINDTVEEAIYEISVNRRLAHIGRASSSESTSRMTSRAQTPAAPQETALDKANNFEMQQAPISTLLSKGKNDGELVHRGDLWNCLFGKPRRNNGGISGTLQMEVDRQVRLDAAEARRSINALAR
jgi:E3 ubiquitin-protein ligase SHPRH